METLNNLLKAGGDSILEKYSYLEGVLSIDIELTEFAKRVRLRITTDHLSFNNFYLGKDEELYKTCRFEIQELQNVLSIENSIYIPSKDFATFMKETRSKCSLAYGKKSSEIKYIFSLVGYDKYISCALSDIASVTIEEID